MKEISTQIGAFGQAEIAALEKSGKISLELSAGAIELTSEDVEISSEDIPGWTVASEGNITVALDITLTEALKQEGIARDIVNRVQNLRKDMGLEVQDKIKITIEKNTDIVNAALESNKAYICTETQALSLDVEDNVLEAQLLEMDEHKIKVKIGM